LGEFTGVLVELFGGVTTCLGMGCFGCAGGGTGGGDGDTF